MANPKLNQIVKARQFRTLSLIGGIVLVLIGLVIVLLSDGRPKKQASKGNVNLTGIVNESFNQDNVDSALVSQQSELEDLKSQVQKLTHTLLNAQKEHENQLKKQEARFESKLKDLSASSSKESAVSAETFNQDIPPELQGKIENAGFWHKNSIASNQMQPTSFGQQTAFNNNQIHTVSFRVKKQKVVKPLNYLNPTHYVPSNTSVKAIVLGGADADASVNSQSKNNGVMLFKFLEDGTLPNGQHSHLKGCRVSASFYGDISSERAFGTLYRLSCAHPGQPIIDREVTGWVFFNGKAGIKGQPLMRDGKIVQWAGFSGALSGVAQAAQYAQSVQQFGALGATSVVPSSNIAEL